MTLYPDSYGTRFITLEQMVAKHGPKMHPEFSRRFFAYIVSEGGRMGVGGGWRAVQPVKPGFAPPGQSFHESQTYASGIVAYAAVDLVHRQPGQKHRSPTWAETDSARAYSLHTFVTGEPWHIQCIEMRGYQMWVNAGRPDPPRVAIPGDPPTPPPPHTITDEVDMIAIDHQPGTPEWTALTWTGVELSHVVDGHADSVVRRAGVQRQTVTDTELDALIRSSQTTTPCPPAWVNTPRGAAWTSSRG
jgi:hypothetical protein